MIKRIRFATKARDVSFEAFATDWPHAVTAIADAPSEARPVRVAVCTTIPELTGPDPKHDGIGFEWFVDDRHLERFDSWLRTAAGRSSLGAVHDVVDRDASPSVVADECVLRGGDWLEQRWREGGEKLKHMAIALRARDLTPAQFRERWRSHAGRLGRGGATGTTVIPDDARGLAYVQDHPRPRLTGAWAYDGLNEVYFDDVGGLQRRIEWFHENLDGGAADDLVRQSWFIAAREVVVPA